MESKPLKRLPLLLALCAPLSANAACNVQFTDSQLYTLQRSFDFGKESGWGWSLAAIAWKESSAGLNLVRFDPPYEYWSASYGVFHNYLKTVMSEEGCTTARCASKIAQNLMTNFKYSAQHAVKTLEYWKKVSGKGNYYDIWKGYNDGYQNTARGKAYSVDIGDKIVYLKTCVRLD